MIAIMFFVTDSFLQRTMASNVLSSVRFVLRGITFNVLGFKPLADLCLCVHAVFLLDQA